MNIPYSIGKTLLPREKIQQAGVETVSTEELLSLILGSGSEHIPVNELARKIIQKLEFKQQLSLDELLTIKGVGLAKACQVLAALELVERLRPIGYPSVSTLTDVLNQVGELRLAQREHIVCLYLNGRMQLLLKETIGIGSVNQAVISPRDIFSVIKYHPVVFLIVLHNHPSGDPNPSASDQDFTQLIWQAGQLLGIELLDHVIVSQNQHYSFREQGQMHFEVATATNDHNDIPQTAENTE